MTGSENTDLEDGMPLHLSVMGRLRAYFFAGVLVTAPMSITFYIAWEFISWIDGWVSPVIPPHLNPQNWGVPGFGLVSVVVGLTIIGALTANFAGRMLMRLSEAVMSRMPVINGIYGAVKQVLETMLANKADSFREVALVEYPRKGCWTIGFIAGASSGQIQAGFEEEMVNVFVPTTPNPTSGFLLVVPKRELKILTMSVEEGFKMLISMGIITPESVAAKIAVPSPTTQP
jgi:uncharacterized membrane protein